MEYDENPPVLYKLYNERELYREGITFLRIPFIQKVRFPCWLRWIFLCSCKMVSVLLTVHLTIFGV